MSEYGHVKISRKAYDSDPFWNEAREFSRWEAWEWMIQAAAWKPYRKATRRAGVLQIERGETPPLAERFLADAWGWGSKNRARRFLDQLLGMGRLRIGKRTADGTTYHLVNYDTYQGERTGDGPVTDRTRTKIEAEKAVLPTGVLSKKGARKGSLDDWTPNEKHAETAAAEGLDLKREELKFRTYAPNRKSPYKDLDAGFLNWLLSANQYGQATGTDGGPRKRPSDTQEYKPRPYRGLNG